VELLPTEHSLSGDNMLWVSVIVQSLHDAKLDFNDTQIIYNPNKRGHPYNITDSFGYKLSQVRLQDYRNCLEARLWFEKQEEDFQMVCALSGLNKDFVYNLYKQVLEDDKIDPTEMLKRFLR